MELDEGRLHEMLRAYEVTRLPGDASLHLVWAEADADDVLDLTEAAPIVLLDAYRVSRIPHAAAS